MSVIGLGTTGASVVNALCRAGVRVYGSDAADTPGIRIKAEQLKAAGAIVDCGGHDLHRIAASCAVVVSPGIPPSAPPVEAAYQAGVEVWSEIDLAFLSLRDRRIMGVTGTNGKTMTTTLIDHVFRTCGLSSVAAGNIGVPLIDVLRLDELPQWIVVELSSFQLHYSHRLVPTVGVLTNLQTDHMDWYDSEEMYFGDKRRLFMNADADSTWIVNGDDPRIYEMVNGVVGSIAYWSLEQSADAWFDRRTGRLLFSDEPIMDRVRYPLLGDHNVANALAAALTARSVGMTTADIEAGLASMPELEHRLETVGAKDGVRWINDSKATNVASAAAALRAMDGNVVLLAGGLDKGEDFRRLAELVRERCSLVIVYGAAAEKLVSQLQPVRIETVGTLAEAVNTARAFARSGDTVLLSPACASFDQFENYIDRGNTFRNLVSRL